MQRRQILHIEDSDDQAELTRRAFEHAGLAQHLVRVKNARQAMDYLTRSGPYAQLRSALPAVVLLDNQLPGMSGLEFLEALRAEPSLDGLPVVMLSGSESDALLRAAYRLRVNSFVQKPTSHEQFALVARQIGQYWTAVNLPPPEKSA